jgi:23S rRNA (adenine2503-C2)-methyltransferase
MDLAELGEALGPDEPAYRAQQLYDAIYRRRVRNLSQVLTLPAVACEGSTAYGSHKERA